MINMGIETTVGMSRARTSRGLEPGSISRRGLTRRTWMTVSAGWLASAASNSAVNGDEVNGDEINGDEVEAGESLLSYDSPQTQTWKMGLILETGTTPCGNILSTFPVPTDWPEQKVRLVDQEVDAQVTYWRPRELAGGVKQVVLGMNQVPAAAEVKLLLTFEIDRSRILGPEKTEHLEIPKRISRDLRFGMGNSPFIDASHPRIKSAAREIAAMPAENDWEKVEQIYDWVRERVEYTEGKLKSASDALSDGKGDCEELTSLFVALCRNNRIPARMVWIPGHCYPEFYLVDPQRDDPQGDGAWFPCQAAGTRQFGRMDEYRPVLQKGDRFKVPELNAPQRYVSEFFTCKKVRGRGEPDPHFVRELIDG